MAIQIKTSNTNLVEEYAGTTTTIIRNLKKQDGIIVPVYSVAIAYRKTVFVLDGNGNKVGIVTSDDALDPVAMMGNNENIGNFTLTNDEILSLFGSIPESNKALGEVLADEIDALIKQDLKKRNIIAE